MGSQISTSNVRAATDRDGHEHFSADPSVDGIPGYAAEVGDLRRSEQFFSKDAFRPIVDVATGPGHERYESRKRLHFCAD